MSYRKFNKCDIQQLNFGTLLFTKLAVHCYCGDNAQYTDFFQSTCFNGG